VAPTAEGIVISQAAAETRNNVKLYAVSVGNVQFLAPGSGDGWKLDGAPEKGVPALIKFSNKDDSSLIVINTLNGDMYWYISVNGRFDEVQMRIKKGDTVFVADRGVLRTAYGDASDTPWYVLESIGLIPPAPAPVSTATASP